MKKVIALFLTMLVLASSALASEYAGGWLLVTPSDNGSVLTEFFYLWDDGRLMYSNRSLRPGEDAHGRDFAGSWTYRGDKIHLVYGNNAQADAYIYKGWLVVQLGDNAYLVFSPYIVPKYN